MERLTRNGFDYCAEYCGSSADCGFFKHEVPTPCGDAAIYNRLAAYEDTGLEPEEINAAKADYEKCARLAGQLKKCGFDADHISMLLDADAEGRLVVLPIGKTKGNKIRQMSDEELAEFLFRVEHRTDKYLNKEMWLNWLKQEVESDG